MTAYPDVSLCEASDGFLEAHTPTCPAVRRRADMGEPVITLLGNERPLPDWIERHDCLEQT